MVVANSAAAGFMNGEDLGESGKNSWIASVKHHEGTFACHTVNLIVVGELSEWEPVAPVGLSVVNKDSEILLDLPG